MAVGNCVCTQGYGFFDGRATFYNRGIVPDPIEPPWNLNPSHPASNCPYIPIPPGLPGSIGPGDSSSARELLHFSWNCCNGERDTEFTLTPSGGWGP